MHAYYAINLQKTKCILYPDIIANYLSFSFILSIISYHILVIFSNSKFCKQIKRQFDSGLVCQIHSKSYYKLHDLKSSVFQYLTCSVNVQYLYAMQSRRTY
jgi:hypothetical protein